ncbi:hypothetical protein JCM11641_004401 [Rhodosporidiobolus odoratus]
METYSLAHLSHTAHLALFHPLPPCSASSLRSRLVSASRAPSTSEGEAERTAVEFAFIDANRITSRLHVLTAISQALTAKKNGEMRTRTCHSEVLWALEPGNNINDSLKHFGLSPTTTSLFLVHLSPLPGSTSSTSSTANEEQERTEVLKRMEALVGEAPLVGLDQLGGTEGEGALDEKGLRKVYKLNTETPTLTTLQVGTDEHRRELDRLVCSSVALKAAA